MRSELLGDIYHVVKGIDAFKAVLGGEPLRDRALLMSVGKEHLRPGERRAAGAAMRSSSRIAIA
jgi:hypothetical protein